MSQAWTTMLGRRIQAGDRGAPAGDAVVDAAPGLAERVALMVIFPLTILLRSFYVFRHGFDSDEWQHLHVVWAATRGLTQYRDVFDNHAPLFHILSVPLVASLGETPDILYVMRLAITPFVVITLWATCLMGRSIGGRRTGLWAAAVLGFVPLFFIRSIEYRPDVLWTMFWILALAVLLGGDLTWRRCLATGLLLGLAVSTSLKSVLLLLALGIAVIALPIASGRGTRSLAPPRPLACALAFVFGLSVVPVALVVYFASRGLLQPFLYGTVYHNYLPQLGSWSRPLRSLFFAPALLLVVVLARCAGRARRPEKDRVRLVFLTLVAGTFLAALHTVWPLFTTYDLLPFYPLLAVLAVGVPMRRPDLAAATPPMAGALRLSGAFFLSAVVLIEIGLVLRWEPPGLDGTRRQVQLMTDVLRLTESSDYVLDMKGESIFRRRPIYYVLEAITRARLERGFFPDNIRERIIATRTCVAAARIDRFPDGVREFIESNYLLLGEVRVAGRYLDVQDQDPGRPIAFEVAIPARYSVVAESGGAAGLLDGEPYTGPRFLEAGPHTFTPSSAADRLALVWAQAIERGFTPFPDGTATGR